jgi:hypothetical protein
MSDRRIPEAAEVHGWKNARACAKKAAMAAHRSRIAAWLALAGIALNASWPLLANARTSVPALPSEICTATGQKHAGESPLSKGTRPSHCALCPFNAERGPAISGVAPALLCPMPASGPVRELFSEPQLPAALDPCAPPRAPPYFS